MRTIKFRAWDKGINEMLPWESENGMEATVQTEFDISELGKDKNYVFMQFTGLLDKNGKEVYEGDIVRIANYPNDFKREEPDFDWQVFQVIWNKNVYAFENSVIYSPFASYNGRTLEEYDMEILGNIYENPELIK